MVVDAVYWYNIARGNKWDVTGKEMNDKNLPFLIQMQTQ